MMEPLSVQEVEGQRADMARAHRSDHRLAQWVSASIAIFGILAVLVPSSVEESPATLVLPDLTERVFYAIWAVGGSLASIGLWRAHLKMEAAGMALIGGGMAAWTVVIIGLLGPARGSYIFLAGLSIGFLHRAKSLIDKGKRGRGE